MQRRHLIQSLLGTAALASGLPVLAQDANPIKILCGFATGGLTDIVARLFADKLRVELNQPVVVDNKVGGGGRIAAQTLKSSPADGLTFMIAPNSGPIFLELMYPRKALGYDLLQDLRPVGTLTTYPFGMVVQRSLGLKNVQDYVAWAKANPKRAMYGVGGAGGQAHFAGTRLSQAMEVPLLAIPYRGNGPVNVDLLGDQLPAAILPASDLMQHRDNPKIQILGVFEAQRSPLIPEVPTFAEQGLKFDVGQAWMGIWASAKTPAPQIQRFEQALRKILSDAAFEETLMTRFTMYPMVRSAAETEQLQRAELALWKPIIQSSGFRPDQ